MQPQALEIPVVFFFETISSAFLIFTSLSTFPAHLEKKLSLYPILPPLKMTMHRRSSSGYWHWSPSGSRHAPWCTIPDQLAIQWYTYWPTPANFNHPLGKNSITLLFLSMKNMFVNCAPCGEIKMSVELISFTWKECIWQSG